MCGRINQSMFEKLYDAKALEFIRKHSMDDCSRKADELESFDNKALMAQENDRMVKEK